MHRRTSLPPPLLAGVIFNAVCLFVSRITEKVKGGFSRNLVNMYIWDKLNFESDLEHILHILLYLQTVQKLTDVKTESVVGKR